MQVKRPLPRASRAFTLIELLTTIAIIAILAALLLQTAGFVQEKAANSRAETEIKALETALEGYKLDYGSYPPGDGSAGSTKELIKALVLEPMAATPPKKPYFEFPPKMLSSYRPNSATDYDSLLTSATNLVDPFGNPYYYEFPGDDSRSGELFFDLYSKGKKGDDNEAKWIKNW